MISVETKRLFSQLSFRLLKSETEELRSTIKYLTKNKTSLNPLVSLLDSGSCNIGSSPDDKLVAKDEQDMKHVERILKLLNKTLPEVDMKKKRVEAHYDVLFSQLKYMVEKSININELSTSSQVPLLDFTNSRGSLISDNDSPSTQLYNQLMILKYTKMLKSVHQMSNIILNKDFNDCDKVWSNISLFNDTPEFKLNLSILLYYRSHNIEIYDSYNEYWVQSYYSLSSTTKRLFWRCISQNVPNESLYNHINNIITKIGSVEHIDIIIMYQSLYRKSHLLPFDIIQETPEPLTINQMLFIQILRILAKYDRIFDTGTKKWMISIVKLSIDNKLILEKYSGYKGSMATESGISIYQYKFIRALDIAIQGIYSSCKGKAAYMPLQQEVENILSSVIEEENEIKSQMSLKFI